MAASVAAMLPLTISGVGLRELVFIWGVKYFHVDEATSIAFTLSFFIVTVITSLGGLFFIMRIDRNAEKHFAINNS